MRYLGVVFVVAVSLGVVACGGGGQSTTTSASRSPGAQAAGTATTAALTPASLAPTAGGTAVAVATATPDPNLLSTANGTVLRSYSPGALDRMNDGNLGNVAHGIGSELPSDAAPPYVFTLELPAVATITGLAAALRGAPQNGPAPSVTFAVSTTGATSGFRDVGTITGSATALTLNAQARWVRVTANQLFDSVGATGTLAPPPANLNPTGIYIEDPVPEVNGSFVASGKSPDDQRAVFVAVGSGLTATECTSGSRRGTYIGQFQGRTWTATFAGNKDLNPDAIRGVVNDDASIIAGANPSGIPVVFMRTTERAKYCHPQAVGSGPHHVLVLDQDPIETFYPVDIDKPLPEYSFTTIGAGMLDATALNGAEAVIARDVCSMPQMLAPQQMALLLQWVAAGHKLVIGGGAGCGTNGADYSWLPYPFTTAAGAEITHAGLIQVENNALGTDDKNDAAHLVDVASYVQNGNNSLANALVVATADSHWCGHFFVAKPTNVNGFVQTYAIDGRGLLIYDGFNDDGNPALQRLRQLELALPVPADLPCSQQVTESFLLEPSQEATFAAGSAQSVHTTMEVLANQGWNGHVTVTAAGDLPATVTPSAFDIAGGTQGLVVAVSIPASTKAGVYTVNVTADNGSGKSAQAAFTVTGTASLKKQFTPTQKRIRIYGIHFDVDSAHIQPRSESVIAQIAEVMRENPSWRFQVEGHTDSDGGAAYNLGLSQRRAQAVVDDLVTRYHIARSRLVAKGFGLTEPVATNATAAGKALNRRVELLRLQ